MIKRSHAVLLLVLFSATASLAAHSHAEPQILIAAEPILLLTDTAQGESHKLDGLADKLGKATQKHYDTLFIGQRKMGKDPLSLTRLVLDFRLPPAPEGQQLVSATLTVHYLNDRAFDRRIPPVSIYHTASANALPKKRQAALDLYAADHFKDTDLDLIRNGMPLGPVSVDITNVLATQYADEPRTTHAFFRLQCLDQPLLRKAQPPIDNRYGIQGFVAKEDDPQPSPPTLTLTFK